MKKQLNNEIGDVLNKEGKTPSSLHEAAQNAINIVKEAKSSFASQFETAMTVSNAVEQTEQRIVNVVDEGYQMLDKARELLKKCGMSEDEIGNSVKERRESRDNLLFKKDYTSLSEFYRTARSLLQAFTDDDVELTDYQFDMKVKEMIVSQPAGAFIVEKYGDQITEILQASDQDLAERVCMEAEEQARNTESLKNDRGDRIDSDVRSIFELLKHLSNAHATTAPLSKNAVDGMIGKVLEDDERAQVFAGEFEAVKKLPAGSVQITFADKQLEFYHHGPGSELDNEFYNEIKGEMPHHVLLVHYRTDDDVRKLLEDMSAGETLTGTLRGAKEPIKIKGCSHQKECMVVTKPDSLSEADLLAAPMKYLSHDITFTID